MSCKRIQKMDKATKRIVNFKIKNQSSDTTEIEIYDYIGEYLDWTTWSMKGITYENFKNEFESAIQNSKTVNLRINTNGGEVNAGLAIYNLIQRHAEKDIHVYVDAAAYSMGIVLAQAVKKGNRHAAKNATLMIHQAMNMVYGDLNAAQLRAEADILDVFDDVLATSISDTMGMDKEEFKNKYFDGNDHFFTAQQAVEHGLIDDIYEGTTTTSDTTSEDKPKESATSNKMLSFIMNRLDALESGVNNIKNKFSTKNKPIMNLNDVLNVLNSGEEITADRRKELAEKIEAFNAAKFTNEEVEQKIAEATQPLESILQTLTEENTALTEQIGKVDEELLNKGGSAPVNANDAAPINEKETLKPIGQFRFYDHI